MISLARKGSFDFDKASALCAGVKKQIQPNRDKLRQDVQAIV